MGGTLKKVIGLLFLSAWFFYYAYQLTNNSKHYADEYYQSYTKLHTYYESNLEKKVKSIAPFIQIPDPDIIKTYKSRIPQLISYAYFVCPVALILGISFMAYPLFVIHLFYTALYDNPWLTTNSNEFDVKKRALLFDACLLASLILVAGTKIYKRKKVGG